MKDMLVSTAAQKLVGVHPPPVATTPAAIGTVTAIAAKTLQVSFGGTSAIPVERACNPAVGQRVVVLKNRDQWIAVAVVGGEDYPGTGTSFMYADAQGDLHRMSKNPNRLIGTNASGDATEYDAAAAQSFVGLGTKVLFSASGSAASQYINWNPDYLSPYYIVAYQAAPTIVMARMIFTVNTQIAANSRNFNLIGGLHAALRPVLGQGTGTGLDFSVFSLDKNGAYYLSFFEAISAGWNIEFYMTMFL
jgi:hypothetical protein